MFQQQASVPVSPLRRRMLDDMAMRGLHEELRGAPGMSLDEVGSEAFGENRTRAGGVPTTEPPSRLPDPEPAAMGREIAEDSSIAAVDQGRRETARRTGARR